VMDACGLGDVPHGAGIVGQGLADSGHDLHGSHFSYIG
jgi:hypothetical protein